MQNSKTIKARKNVEFNVDIFTADKKRKKLLTNGLGFANIIFALERAADVSKETKK